MAAPTRKTYKRHMSPDVSSVLQIFATKNRRLDKERIWGKVELNLFAKRCLTCGAHQHLLAWVRKQEKTETEVLVEWKDSQRNAE